MKSIEISVFGQKIRLKHDARDPKLAEGAAKLVLAKLQEAEKRLPGGASHHIALLALMDLAGEYLQAKERTAEYQRRLGKKAEALLKRIDQELGK